MLSLPRHFRRHVISCQVSYYSCFLSESRYKISKVTEKPIILPTSFFVVGGWISLIVAILPGSGSIQPDPTIWPTNFILFCAKLHFLKFKVSPVSSTVCKNFSRCSKWSFQFIETTAMSSTNGSVKLRTGCKTWVIARIKVLLADLSPNGILVNSKSPASHTNAVSH